jgi:DNA polymerase-4
VQSERPTLQVSAEDTFESDLLLDELEPHIRRLAEKAWAGHLRETGRIARTVVLKLKTSDFHTLTRSYTPAQRPSSANELANIACALRERVERPADSRYRLVGVGLGGFVDQDSYRAQSDLFDTPTI